MRTGTRPYLAYELHPTSTAQKPPTHLYRHDLESLFYVFFLLVTVHDLQRISKEEPPRFELVLQPDTDCYRWFSLDDELLNLKKNALLTNPLTLAPTSTFTELGGILRKFHGRISMGLSARSQFQNRAEDASMAQSVRSTGRKIRGKPVEEAQSFDDATLGGYFTYDNVMDAFLLLAPFKLEEQY